MHDVAEDRKVVVKKMPMHWFGTSHADFNAHHKETEQPWQDLGCLTYLNQIGYDYACALHGVFRDADFAYVVFSWATDGDLLTWIKEQRPSMGINAEEHLRPLILQLLESVAQLHGLSIVHGDLSLENAVLTTGDIGTELQLIDFAMSSTRRLQAWHGGGKVMYVAPELYTAGEHDGFLADTFALGIMIFTMVIGTYPWRSTQAGVCPRFDCFKKYGICALLDIVWKSDGVTSATALSQEFQQFLQGILAVNPTERLTLGEEVYSSCSRSVWCEPWVGA
jgi:serine/threonine protein kinase